MFPLIWLHWVILVEPFSITSNGGVILCQWVETFISIIDIWKYSCTFVEETSPHSFVEISSAYQVFCIYSVAQKHYF